MVLYNLFIIVTLPKIFDIIDNIDNSLSNFKLPNCIITLLETHDDNSIHERNINYDYFKEKPNEIIQFQNVCFSLENIFIFKNIIECNRKILIDNNKNLEQKNILNEFCNSIIKSNLDINNMEEKKKEK